MAFLFLVVERPAFNRQEEPLFFQSDPDFFIVQNQSESIKVQLRKRQDYPTTFCRQINSGWQFGYGKNDNDPNSEFLLITVLANGTVTVERDQYATLPLLYSHQHNLLILSNEYGTILDELPQLQLSRAGVLESLISQFALPYIQNLGILREQEALTFAAGELRISYPENRNWLRSADVPRVDPIDFRSILDAFLDNFIETRLKGRRFAFEVSGGLDSATLPQYYTKTHQNKAPLAAILFRGKFEASQRQKLNLLAQETGNTTFATTLDTATMFPLSRMVMTNKLWPHYCENILSEAATHLFEQLQKQGITVICRGSGADELFANITDPADLLTYGEVENTRRKTKKVPSFTTSAFRQDYVAHTPAAPRHSVPLYPPTTRDSLIGNNLYIRHDIWPVSPFINSRLYTWCQGLPAYLRANKAILRSYHYAYEFIPDIYNPVQNEDFADFLTECFAIGRCDSFLHDLAANSVTARLGYVDIKKLLTVYDEAKNTRSNDDLFNIFLWMSTEINLQCTPRLAIQ